jgi:uncharacterized membrane protein YcaP (DUF421 family)
MADAGDLKSLARKSVPVRVREGPLPTEAFGPWRGVRDRARAVTTLAPFALQVARRLLAHEARTMTARKRESSETGLPGPPRIERRLAAPLQLAMAVAMTALLPILGVAGFLGSTALERVLRVVVVFAVLLLVFRVIGKRELSRLSPFELVTLMLVPEVLSNAVQAQGSLLDALAGLGMLFLLVLATSALAHRFERVEQALEPRSTLLIDRGRVLSDALNRERIMPEELVSEMHKHGIADVSEVRWAVLESGGTITFIPKQRPAVSASDEDVHPT